MRGIAKKGSMRVEREDPALRRFTGGLAEPARRGHVDNNAFSDPAFYLKYPDRGPGEAR